MNGNVSELETPCLLLDKTILQRNADRFAEIAIAHDVLLRPHLKTAKSVDVANILTKRSRHAAVTVSTLAEADYFAQNGYRDILYAVGMAPNKLSRIAHIQHERNVELLLITDNVVMAQAAAVYADREQVRLNFLIEIDCGDKRGGVQGDSEELRLVATALDTSSMIRVRGVMTHAGQSYATNAVQDIQKIAEQERDSVVGAAARLTEMGFDPDIISVGSTPTIAFAKSLAGVTEARAGVYGFFDLDQFGRGVCALKDISLSVLATVIGHNHAANAIILDSGGLALSKDSSAKEFVPDAHYGYVCDAQTLERFGALSVNAMNQEHGKIYIEDSKWYGALPIGGQVRILPNHACFTAAAYAGYHVIENGEVVHRWPRVNGWY